MCFERQSDWGGLWHYTWRTGLDEHGEPVHCSMYRYLWTNGPKECLEFGDYSFEEHFGKPIPSFPPYAVLNNYILGRAEKSDVRKYIRFNTAVRDVRYCEASGKFTVRSTDLNEQANHEEEFDHVIVAIGHFSVPNVPSFEGIDRFPGRVLHGHDFRDALEFKGKRLLIVGASYSAEDIALQNLKYGAASVTCTYRTGAMGFKWPEGIEELPLVTKFEGSTAHFGDGSTREIDAVILCTGYQHHFPFMEDSLRLRTHNRMWTPNLYKGVVWMDNTKLAYLGMQDQYYTFSMFDAQAWYVRDAILGRIALPSREEMEKDSAELAGTGRGAPEPDRRHRLPDRLLQGHLRPDRLRHRLGRPVRQLQALGAPQGRGHRDLSRPLASVAGHGQPGALAPHEVVGRHGRHAGNIHGYQVTPGRTSAGLGASPGPAFLRLLPRDHRSRRSRPRRHERCPFPQPPAIRSTAPSSLRQSSKPPGRSLRHRSSLSESSGRPSRLAARTARPSIASVR